MRPHHAEARRRHHALFAVLVLGIWALPASHDNGSLDGNWEFIVRLEETGRSTVTFRLKQDGSHLSGLYDGSYGQLPIEGPPVVSGSPSPSPSRTGYG
tara:strand:+ start:591 stop:884 length:294 start_codon:yes stop_codon:yes gene_type:complete